MSDRLESRAAPGENITLVRPGGYIADTVSDKQARTMPESARALFQR